METLEILDLALSFAEATSAPHFHKTSFRVRKKIFGTLDKNENTLVVKLNEVDQSVFSDMGGEYIYPVPGGWGRKGWTILNYTELEDEMVRDALRISYCNVAPDSLARRYQEG